MQQSYVDLGYWGRGGRVEPIKLNRQCFPKMRWVWLVTLAVASGNMTDGDGGVTGCVTVTTPGFDDDSGNASSGILALPRSRGRVACVDLSNPSDASLPLW